MTHRELQSELRKLDFCDCTISDSPFNTSQPPPKCRCSARRSSIWDVSSTSGRFVTTRSARSLCKTSPRGQQHRASYTPFKTDDANGIETDMKLVEQTSSAIHYPEHDSSRPCARRGAASAGSDALLHPADADQEPVHFGWQGQGCLPRLQDDEGMSQIVAVFRNLV